MTASDIYKPSELYGLPTLCVGQCCSLKVDTGTMRVWLCRVAGGVTIERLRGGKWEVASGSCDAQGDEQWGECPHCGDKMQIGDEDESERICDACAEDGDHDASRNDPAGGDRV